MDKATRVSNPPRMYFLILSELRNRFNIVMSPADARPYARVKAPVFQGRATSIISQRMRRSNVYRPNIAPMRLFISQGDQGIDPHRSARRDQATQRTRQN